MRVLDLDMDYFMKSVATFIGESETDRLPEDDYGDYVLEIPAERHAISTCGGMSVPEQTAQYSA